jgi:hypothetical protein
MEISMAQSVFLLRHEREVEELEHIIVLGVYSTRQAAEEAQEYFRTQRGFRDYPDGFVLQETLLDQHMWSEGFVTWSESLDSIKE